MVKYYAFNAFAWIVTGILTFFVDNWFMQTALFLMSSGFAFFAGMCIASDDAPTEIQKRYGEENGDE